MDLPQLDTHIDYTIQQERMISEEGIEKVREYLITNLKDMNDSNHSIVTDYLLRNVDTAWVTKEGTYPKRLSKEMYKLNCSMPGRFDFKNINIGKLGSLSKKYALSKASYTFDITRDISWRNGDFGDKASCFWGTNARAKDLLMDNGGMALRFYKKDDILTYKGISRSWIVPKGDRIVIFNAYGHYELHTQAEVLSKYLGVEHKEIDVVNYGNEHGLLYINGTGRLLGVPPIDTVNYIDLELGEEEPEEERWECEHCGHMYGEDEGGTVDESSVCDDCYSNANECYQCGSRTFDSLNDVRIDARRTREFCQSCAESEASWCEYHDIWHLNGCPERESCEKHGETVDECGDELCSLCVEEKENEE